MLNLLSDIKRQRSLSLLFISHDLSVVQHVSDRLLVLYLGHVMEVGAAKDIYANPQHPYTKRAAFRRPDHRFFGQQAQADPADGGAAVADSRARWLSLRISLPNGASQFAASRNRN